MSGFAPSIDDLHAAALCAIGHAPDGEERNGNALGFFARNGLAAEIPVAFEALSMLVGELEKIAQTGRGSRRAPPLPAGQVPPAGVYLQPVSESECGVALGILALDVGPDALAYVAHWCVDLIPSAHLKTLPGRLIVPYRVLRSGAGGGDVERDRPKSFGPADAASVGAILPEWWAAYYVNASPSRCVPVLTMRTALDREGVGDAWPERVLELLDALELPCAHARQAVMTPQAGV